MTTYRVSFEIVSSVRTPFQSDTIFGHLCWAIRFLFGEEKLRKWLEEFPSSPTLLSNAFPEKLFPRPLCRPLPPKKASEQFPSAPEKLDIDFLIKRKKIKKINFISENWFWENQHHLSPSILLSHLSAIDEESEMDIKTENLLISHNRFNRNTGRADEGGLYDFEEIFYAKKNKNRLNMWFLIKTQTLSKDEIEKILSYLEWNGFGADNSSGKGVIKILKLEEFIIPSCPQANAVISLANFYPSSPECLNGYYNILTKFGKLGGTFASGYNPFKKPLIMVEAGALILDSNYTPDKHYGSLVNDVHTNSAIKHYGYAFPIPVHYEE